MRAAPLLPLALLGALAACAPPPGSGSASGADVRVERTSIVGTWRAVAVVGDELATRDYESGRLETTLLVRRGGQAVLTGTDRRAGGRPATFGGAVEGDRLVLRGLDGAARLRLDGRRLLLEDPRGRTTVYVRVGA